MEGNVSHQVGVDGATYKLGRFFFHWCVAFGVVILLAFSVLALIRGAWWISDVSGGNAANVFNYVGMAWFTIVGLVGIPLALKLGALRKTRLQGR